MAWHKSLWAGLRTTTDWRLRLGTSNLVNRTRIANSGKGRNTRIWKLDQRAYDQATRELWQKKTVSATFIGRLDARSEGLQTSRGVGNGYGQLGRFPAQLVIVTVKDVSEKRR